MDNFELVLVSENAEDGTSKDDETKKGFFIKKCVAIVGMTSKNGILYTEELVKSIMTQINENKVAGRFGHILPHESAYKYDIPDCIWVQAEMQDDKLIATASVISEQAQKYFSELKKHGGRIGTSIYGTSTKLAQDDKYILKGFVLESIDFASVNKVSLDTGDSIEINIVETVTGSDADDYDGESNGGIPLEEEKVMRTPEEILMGLTDEEVVSLRDYILSLYPIEESTKPPEEEPLAEMQTKLDESLGRITEMTQTISELELKANNATYQQIVSEYLATTWASCLKDESVAEFAQMLKKKVLIQGDIPQKVLENALNENKTLINLLIKGVMPNYIPDTNKKDLSNKDRISKARANTGI